MRLEHLPPGERWNDLLQSLDFTERRFAAWEGQKALQPKLLEAIRSLYEVRRTKWAAARSAGLPVPTDTGLPEGHAGESPASRLLRYWIHVSHEVRRCADEGQLSLAESHALLTEVRERQAALERRLAPEELPEALPADVAAEAGEVPVAEPVRSVPRPRRSLLKILLDPRNIQMLLAFGGA